MTHSNEFKTWIKQHNNDYYQIISENDNLIKLTTEYGESSITFTDIEDNTIVEFSITSYKDNSSKFYLHFELVDEDHAKQLYDEMVETLVGLKDEKTLRILLSCSAGLTTGMFADMLQSTASMLGLDYEFNAVSYLNIYEEASTYDVILIAPQIGYMLSRLKETLTDKLVLQIPTSVFAKYDALEAIKYIQSELEIYYENKNTKENTCEHCTEYENRILSIAIQTNYKQTRINYQLHDKCEIIDSQMIKKCKLNIYDLYDIIDTILLKHGHLDMIGIAMPGIVEDSKQWKDPHNGEVVDIKSTFEDKYHIDVFVYNNANAAAVGFNEEHPEYSNVVYHSQPFGYGIGGQGIVINGQSVRGKNGIAGEIRYFLRRMQLSDDTNKLIKTEHGALEVVTKALLPTIVTVGPEAVALYSPMTPDMDEVKHALSSFISEEFLPEFYYIKEPYPYILSGITKMCVDYINNKE